MVAKLDVVNTFQTRRRNMSASIYPVSEFEGYQTLSYAAKGHHDPTEFIRLLEREYGQLADPQDVRHEYWRNVPTPEGMTSMPCQKGRGAYAVTTVDAGDTRRIVKVA